MASRGCRITCSRRMGADCVITAQTIVLFFFMKMGKSIRDRSSCTTGANFQHLTPARASLFTTRSHKRARAQLQEEFPWTRGHTASLAD